MKITIALALLSLSFAVNASNYAPPIEPVTTGVNSCVCKFDVTQGEACDTDNGYQKIDWYVTNYCANNSTAKIVNKTYIFGLNGEVKSIIIYYEVIDPSKKACNSLFGC